VFIKSPKPGEVKTRLAAEIGAQAACELYRGWVGQVLQSLQSLRADGWRVVGFITGGPASDFGAWAGLVDDWLGQPPGDLGARLAGGFTATFAAAPKPSGVFAVGTDCLEVDAALCRQAATTLESRDLALGPAHDGGYYLIGCRREWPGLFDGIRWSSPDTCQDQRRRAEELGATVGLLPALADIDTLPDWQAWQRRLGMPPA
jgi:hypothetical protein